MTLSELVGEEEGCDLAVCKHISAYRVPFKSLYYNKPGSTIDIGKLDTSNFTYVYSGHFVAKRNALLMICDYVNEMIEEDRQNKKFLTEWYPKNPVGKTPVYDETYFNFYLNTVVLKSPDIKVNILDGNIYAHAWYSPRRQYKVEMLNKDLPYHNARPSYPRLEFKTPISEHQSEPITLDSLL